MGVLSFDQGKMIACGEGVMLLTNDLKYDEYARQYHENQYEFNINYPRGKDTKNRPGFNYRILEMQSSRKSSIKKIGSNAIEKQKIFLMLNDKLINNFQLRNIPVNFLPNYDTFILFEKING